MSDSRSGPRVLDVPSGWTLPTLGKKVVAPGGRVERDETRDTMTRFDTAAGDLASLDVALVRGSGSTAPWTLTIDGSTGEYPAEGRGVPVAVRELLLGVRAGAALRASGRALVSRVTHRVCDEAGAELCTVTEVDHREPNAVAQCHVELAGWEGSVFDAALARLVKAGAVPRSGDTAPRPAGVEAGSVGSVLLGFVREQRRAIVAADLGMRRGEDTVHAFRVAIRRTRSALRVVDVTDAESLAALDAELRWLSGVLGQTRDLQVLREHLAASIEDLAPRADIDLALAQEAVIRLLDADEAAARATLTTTLAGRRYLAVLRALRDWCEQPPFAAAAAEPEQRLSRYVRAAAKDLDKRLAKAGGSARKLHGARKAAKRARYVAAFVGEAAGKHGAEIAGRAKSLQTSLGDHQDCVLAAEFLRRAAENDQHAAAAFGCGVLWAHEQDRAAAALRAAEKAQHR